VRPAEKLRRSFCHHYGVYAIAGGGGGRVVSRLRNYSVVRRGGVILVSVAILPRSPSLSLKLEDGVVEA
jgi:hypothetical protein